MSGAPAARPAVLVVKRSVLPAGQVMVRSRLLMVKWRLVNSLSSWGTQGLQTT